MDIRRSLIAAAVLAAVAGTPAFAKGGHGHGHKHGHDDHDRVVEAERHHGDHRHAAFDRHGRRGCPPGLAKKHNGCLPPGQAKKLAIGHSLPPGAVYVVPQRVRATLPPPPRGHRYAVVNNQVVLVSNTNIVVNILDVLG